MHRGSRKVATDARQQQLVPLPRHAVAGVRFREGRFLLAVGGGVRGAYVACVRHAVQVVVRRAGCQGTVVGHDDVVTRAFAAQDVDQSVVVDVEQGHVVAVRHPVEVGVAVGVLERAIDVFVDGHAAAAVARWNVDIHVRNHHVEVAVQVEVGRVHVATKAVARAESQIDGVESEADVGGVRRGGEHLVGAVVHHVKVQEAIAVEIHHLKHVGRCVRHEVLPRREVACSVVEQDDDAPRIPWEHVVERGVFDDVQVAVAVHVVDLACGAERAVEQIARSGGTFVGEVAGAIVDEQKVLGGAASAVDAVVHEVQILRSVARQIARPDGTDQGLVAGQCGQPVGGLVCQTEPLPAGVFPQIHVKHGLLVEGVDDHDVVPRVVVHIHHVHVAGETRVGQKFRGEFAGHVRQHPVLVHQEQVRLGGLACGRERLLAHHNHVRPTVFVEVRRPNVFLLVVRIGDSGELQAFVRLKVPFKPLRTTEEGWTAERAERARRRVKRDMDSAWMIQQRGGNTAVNPFHNLQQI